MRVIGVTGGVGAGKSTVLGILEEEFQAYVIQADQLGHILMEPGEECYDAVIALFGKEIIKKDKTIDRRRISDVVFTDKDMLLKLNGIIHPAVKQRILRSSWRTEGSRKRNLCCGSCSFSGRKLSRIL
ncbi:MAG: dephospho-CoA kinase [Blautia massiliensis (ex Durand et al. 2017)]